MVRAQQQLTDISDENLLLRFRQTGDKASIEVLVRRHQSSLLKFCRMQVGPAGSEDLCQKTFIAILNQTFLAKGPGSFRGWLFGVAANMCRMHLRTHARRKRKELGLMEQNKYSGRGAQRKDSGEWNDSMKTAWREFHALPNDQRLALDLNAIQNFSCEEVGKIMGVSRATANRLIMRAKESLKKRLAGLGISSVSVAGALELLKDQQIDSDIQAAQNIVDQILIARENQISESNGLEEGIGQEAAASGITSKLALLGIFTVTALAGVGVSAWYSPKADFQKEANAVDSAVPIKMQSKIVEWDFTDPYPDEEKGIYRIMGQWKWLPDYSMENRKGIIKSSEDVAFVFDYAELQDPICLEIDARLNGTSRYIGGWFSREEDVLRTGTQDLTLTRFIREKGFVRLNLIFAEGKCYQLFKDSRGIPILSGYRTIGEPDPNDTIYLLLSAFTLDKVRIRPAKSGEVDQVKRMLDLEQNGPPLPYTWNFNHINDQPGLNFLPSNSWTWKKDIGRKEAGQASGGVRFGDKNYLIVGSKIEKLPIVLAFDLFVGPKRKLLYLEASWMNRDDDLGSRKVENRKLFYEALVLKGAGWVQCKYYFFENMIIEMVNEKVVLCAAHHRDGPESKPVLGFDNSKMDNLSIRYAEIKDIPDRVMKIKNKCNKNANAMNRTKKIKIKNTWNE